MHEAPDADTETDRRVVSAGLDMPVDTEFDVASGTDHSDTSHMSSLTIALAVQDDCSISEEHMELRRLILSIQNSTTLSEKEKAGEMQKIMTTSYNASAGRSLLPSECIDDIQLTANDLARTYYDEEHNILGCAHYQRACKIQCSTCNAWATCRFCHNERHPDHELIRTDTRTMMCMQCLSIQPAAQSCRSCTQRMAVYYCNKCKLWDDDANKHIYHCQDCGICRVGHGLGKDFFRKF